MSAALRTLLQDWMLVVTQLEHQLRLGQLSMQALVYYCQGPLASLKLLAAISAEAASKRLTAAGAGSNGVWGRTGREGLHFFR